MRFSFTNDVFCPDSVIQELLGNIAPRIRRPWPLPPDERYVLCPPEWCSYHLSTCRCLLSTLVMAI
jgi:hypothetical protein